MASSVYAAIQPPSEEGEKPVTVLVTGFGVRTLLLLLLLLLLLALSDTLKDPGSCWGTMPLSEIVCCCYSVSFIPISYLGPSVWAQI